MKPRLIVVAFSVLAGSNMLLAQQPVPGMWEIVPSPNGGAQLAGNVLLDVVAISPTDAWAVGTQPNQSQYLPKPLAMHWDGAQWSTVSTPTVNVIDVRLNSVDAVASDDVWAVGYSYNYDCGLCAQTLIEHWDGQSWSIVPSPNPGVANQLFGVAARSATDIWAVGDQWLNASTKVPLVLHYNGANWAVVDTPPVEYGELNSVFALAAGDVWAVGIAGVLSTGFETLTLHWDGTSWTQVPFPTEPGALYVALYSVSGAASDDVWAVGVHKYLNWQGHQLSVARTYHWDGSSWTSVLPGVYGTDSRMYDVYAVASDDAWAVGGEPCPQFNPPCSDPNMAFRYVTVHWDGVSWSNVETPNQGVLLAVAASSGCDAWAVGWGMDSLAYSTGTHTLRYTCACAGDFDGSGVVSSGDITAFLAAWFGDVQSGGTAADFNGSGLTNSADITAFLGAWFEDIGSGC